MLLPWRARLLTCWSQENQNVPSFPATSTGMLQEWARGRGKKKKKLLQCPIYAPRLSLRNNSCCHQPLIFLVFDIIHGDKFGDIILHRNPEPFKCCSSRSTALETSGHFGTALPGQAQPGPASARDAAFCQMKLVWPTECWNEPADCWGVFLGCVLQNKT